MSSVAKRRSQPTATPVPSPPSALQKVAQNFAIELAPFPDGDAALAFKAEAAQIIVTDTDSHRAALEALRRGKALKRGIDDHWRKVLRWLEDRKRDIRTIMDTDLELVDPGITALSTSSLAFEHAERERVRLEEDRQRIANERIADEKRERELADLERQAQQAEATSADLSDRERAFVMRCHASLGADLTSARWLNAAAESCGFKQDGYGVTLFKREKIQYALTALKQAQAIREQAAAVAEKPVEVTKVEVQSNLAKVAGTRTVKTYTGECFDYRLYVESFQRGLVDIEQFMQLTQPSTTGGNSLARSLRENLDRVPGWRHILTETKAG